MLVELNLNKNSIHEISDRIWDLKLLKSLVISNNRLKSLLYLFFIQIDPYFLDEEWDLYLASEPGS